jgi:diacylglycerol kinase (ATP)
LATLLLHNPTAGAAHPTADELITLLNAAGLRPRYHSIKDEDYRKALEDHWDLVVIAGGDGTVAKVARALKRCATPLAILPVGTANNVANALGIVGEAGAIISGLGNAKTRRLDVGLAHGPWGKRRFVEAVGFGTIAKAIAHGGPKPPKALRIDMGREQLKTFLEETEAERHEVHVDHDVFVGEFLLVEVLNLSRTGPALPISPASEPDDKLLDIAFVFASDRKRMLSWLKDPEGKFPPVTVRRGRNVRLDWKGGHARIDDKVFFPPDSASAVEITHQSESLTVLVPEPTSLT